MQTAQDKLKKIRNKKIDVAPPNFVCKRRNVGAFMQIWRRADAGGKLKLSPLLKCLFEYFMAWTFDGVKVVGNCVLLEAAVDCGCVFVFGKIIVCLLINVRIKRIFILDLNVFNGAICF